jgi:hypothetical protein
MKSFPIKSLTPITYRLAADGMSLRRGVSLHQPQSNWFLLFQLAVDSTFQVRAEIPPQILAAPYPTDYYPFISQIRVRLQPKPGTFNSALSVLRLFKTSLLNPVEWRASHSHYTIGLVCLHESIQAAHTPRSKKAVALSDRVEFAGECAIKVYEELAIIKDRLLDLDSEESFFWHDSDFPGIETHIAKTLSRGWQFGLHGEGERNLVCTAVWPENGNKLVFDSSFKPKFQKAFFLSGIKLPAVAQVSCYPQEGALSCNVRQNKELFEQETSTLLTDSVTNSSLDNVAGASLGENAKRRMDKSTKHTSSTQDTAFGNVDASDLALVQFESREDLVRGIDYVLSLRPRVGCDLLGNKRVELPIAVAKQLDLAGINFTTLRVEPSTPPKGPRLIVPQWANRRRSK